MSFVDKIKGMFKGNKQQVEKGIDKAADVVDDKVPEQHADTVQDVAEKAKDAVDKID